MIESISSFSELKKIEYDFQVIFVDCRFLDCNLVFHFSIG